MMNSLHQLLSEEGFGGHSKQAYLSHKSITLPINICNDQKIVESIEEKSSTDKGSSLLSSKRRARMMIPNDEPTAIDEVAVRAVVSILGGYIGRYIKDPIFRETIRNKCNSCLVRKGNDAILANIERIDKLVEGQVISESLRSSIQLMNSAASTTGSTPDSYISACANFYLSICYKLDKNDGISASHLLQVFSDSPFFARTHLLPDLWEHFFLPHLLHIKIWYHDELETLSNSQFLDKEKRIKALSEAYNKQTDIGTVQFANYYKEWLKVGGRAPSAPDIPLPSRPNSAADDYSSHSSINRSIFAPEHHSMELNRNSVEEMLRVKDGNNYDNDKKMRTRRKLSSADYRFRSNEFGTERQKSAGYLRLCSCQNAVSECLVKSNHIIKSNSINNLEFTDQSSSELSKAITNICSSDSLTDCEIAIRVITKAWLDSLGNPLIEKALLKAPIIEGIFEVLFASDDEEILELAISILSEFVARNDAYGLIILNSDPQLEIFMRFLKSSSLFLKAAVLLYQLKPKAKQMICTEWVTLVLHVLEFGDQLQTLFAVRCFPRKAALYLLDQLLTGFSEDKNLENASQVVSFGGLSFLLRTFEKGETEERNIAAVLMSCCIRANGSCRKYLAENIDKSSLLELIAIGIQNNSSSSSFTLLIELLCLNSGQETIKFLTELNNGWRVLNAMHIFVVYLQRAFPEERPLVAAILLQLDLLGDPSRCSLYREDAIEAIIEALESRMFKSQFEENSAKALLMLGGYFSHTRDTTVEEWLLQQIGYNERCLDLLFNKQIIDGGLTEEEKAMEDWQRKVAIVLLNTGGKRLLAALSNSIANGTPNLAQSCLFTVSWMNKVLHSLGDQTFQSLAYSAFASESSNYDRDIVANILPPDAFNNLIKSSECITMLSTLDKELIDPLRDPHDK